MRPYRMKHIPTGLYFQPCTHRGSHLSKKGKIYQTNSNGIEKRTGHTVFRIFCRYNSQTHKITKGILAWSEPKYNYDDLFVDTRFEDWIREEI